MNKIGFHISSEQGAQSDWIRRYNSAVHLVLAVGAGGEVPRIAGLAANFPQSRFIYRAWSYGSVGASDHFEWYLATYGTDPEPLIQMHEGAFQALAQYPNISYQLWNETGHDEHLWPHFIEFNRRYVVEMDRRGLSAAVLGLGPGHPGRDGREALRQTWFQARPLFEAIINARQTHLINLHEYSAYPWARFYPWIVGRFEMMIEDIRLMGLPTDKIHVVIGESGYTDPNALGMASPTGPNGYRWSLSQGHSADELAEDYAAMVRAVYDPSPNVLGLCYYCLGDSGGWAEFDLLREPGILQRLETLLVHKPPEEPPVIEIIETPVTEYTVTADLLNVRTAPSLSAVSHSKVPKGTPIITNGYVDAEGYRWRRLISGLFCAEYPLGNPAASWLVEHTNETWKVEALARLADIKSTVEALTVLVNGAR